MSVSICKCKCKSKYMGARDPMTASIFKDTSSGPSGGELGLYCEGVLE